MKTIKINNTEIIYNESDMKFGEIYTINDEIIIPGGIFGDKIISMSEASKCFVIKLNTSDSSSYNGWSVYEIGIDKPVSHQPINPKQYIHGYNKLYPINDILPLYITDKEDGFTNRIMRTYFYVTVIVEKGNVYNNLAEAINHDNTFDYINASFVPNCYEKIEVKRQLALIEDDGYGD